MTQLVFHHDIEQLKNLPNGVIPVHLYGVGNTKLQIANIGNKVLDEVKRLGIEPSSSAKFNKPVLCLIRGL